MKRLRALRAKTIRAVDLFCGAGGTSSGLIDACRDLGLGLDLLAINHWDIAIQTHTANHADVRHICDDLENLDPREVVPSGKLRLLVASPPCTHFSNARGGKPMSRQSRATIKYILRWVAALDIQDVLIENVREFCFPADTLVTTKGGLLPIEEIEVGDEVLTHRGRWRRVTNTTRHEAATVNVRGNGNSILECTDNHPFYARAHRPQIQSLKDGKKYNRHWLGLGEPGWVQAKDLVPNTAGLTTYQRQYAGFAWATPRVYPKLDVPYFDMDGVDGKTVAFWNMVGRWLGDGWIRYRRDRADGLRICDSLKGATLLGSQLSEVSGLTWNAEKRPSVVVYATVNARLAKWVIEHFGEKADGKHLPMWVTSLPEDLKRALIDGYALADGNLRPTGRHMAGTISKRLALGLKMLLETLGVTAGIGKFAPPESLSGSVASIKIQSRRQAYWVSWKWGVENSPNRIDDDLHRWTKVRSVRPASKKADVYNLTVEEDHSFVADGIVVHNCTWGPLHRTGKLKDRPIESRKGEYFRRFITKLQTMGYKVEHHLLVAADYGDATSRKRLFIRARKGKRPIKWPEPTHGKSNLFGQLKPYRTAREIIDWSDKGTSIFNRKKPLSPNTMRRIMAGFKKFSGLPFILPNEGFYKGNQPRSLDETVPTITQRGGGALIEPFIVKLYGQNDAADIDKCLPTVTAQGQHLAVAQPEFIIQMAHNGDEAGQARYTYPTSRQLPTVDGQGMFGLVEPYVLGQQSGATPRSTDEPVPTIATDGAIGLAQPFVLAIRGGDDGYLRASGVEEPVGAITRHPAMALVEPFIVPTNHGKDDVRAHDIDKSMPTITSVDALGLAEPYLVDFHTEREGQDERVRSVDRPMQTVAASPTIGLAQPYIVKFNGTAIGQQVNEPLGAVTGRDRFALAIPVQNGVVIVDILFRMLQPKELGRAHSFGDHYTFAGTREEKVKQIGGSVPRLTAKALCLAALSS